MASGDLTDLATVYIAAGIETSTTETDTVLASLISSISAYVPNVLNVNVLADNYLELYEGNGKDSLMLRQRPVIQVSSVAWRGQIITAQADPILGGSGVYSDGYSVKLSGYLFPQGEMVRVAYSAGFMTVPADLSLAVAELVAEAFARRKHVGETSRSQQSQITTAFEAKSMHAAIADKLSNYRFVVPC
jgi:hypothetical protein